MGILDFGKKPAVAEEPQGDTEKHIVAENVTEDKGEVRQNSVSDAESEEFQNGVRRVRAVTDTWSIATLVILFVFLYLFEFIDQLLVSVQGSLNPYITSEFGKHGLVAAVSVVPSIIGGTSGLTIAKIIDIWGRLEGFLVMLVFTLVGLIMKATCKNIETYIAAHTLYWTGHLGTLGVIDVMISDITSLQNRMILITLKNTPIIASTFAGPRIAKLFYENVNFRWAFGAFAIMLAAAAIPITVLMITTTRKAASLGKLPRTQSGRTLWQSIVHYVIELDIIGIILITAGFALFLLPFSLSTYAPKGWESGYIIAMIVVGVVLLFVFYVWERYCAPVNFIKWKYLQDTTVIGSCMLYGFMFLSVFIWNAYFGSYLQVVHRLDIDTSGYVLNSFSLTSAILSPVVAGIISATGRFKLVAYAGVPMTLLGTALLIPFRSPSTGTGVLVMTQIFVGLGTGIWATCGQLAIMAPVTHQEIAAVNAIWGLFGSIGAAIGFAIAGSMWTNILPKQLAQRLPEASKDQAASIYGDMVLQMGFADGTPERDAIVGAYADVMRKMVIAGACFVPLCLASVYLWRNINVKKLEKEEGTQTKGTVF